MKEAKETIKTIVITVLVTGIIAFVGGVQYEKTNSKQIEQSAQTLLKSVPTAQAAVK